MDIRHHGIVLTYSAFISSSAFAGNFKVAVGAFFSQADTSIGVADPNAGNGYDLDFESDLNLKERSTLPYVLL